MTITIVKEKSFYFLLPLYKSFLFYFVKFKPSSNLTPQTKLVIKGLNIKNRRKRITYVYDKCCDIIENQEKGQNVCGFVNKQCFKQRVENKGEMYGCCSPLCVTENGCTTKNLSCKLIFCKEAKEKYLAEKSKIVAEAKAKNSTNRENLNKVKADFDLKIKNAKVENATNKAELKAKYKPVIAEEKYKVLEYKDLILLKLLSLKNRLIVWSDFYSTREEVLGDLYCYTITFTLYRIAFRRIKKLLLKFRNNNG